MTAAPPPAAPDAPPAWVQRAERVMRRESTVRQAAVVVALAVLTTKLLEPPADGRVVAHVLLVLNIAVAATRLLPERWPLPRIPLYVVGAALAGALVMLDRSNASSTFAYFIAGNAGFRLPAHRAFTVAGWTAACGVTGLAVGHTQGWTVVPWWVGLLTALPVLIGLMNRSRAATEAALRAAAESRAQAVEAESRAAASAERARIARDVHDVLAHSLAGVNMQLEVVDALLENGDAAAAREAAARAQRQVREGMAEVSRTVHALRQDALPLVETLTMLVASSADAAFEVTGDEREVATPQATALARVAQEALTNARKHAPGSSVRVVLAFTPGTVTLDVVNARPTRTAPLTDAGSGMGLVGMRERIEIVGGRLRTGPVTEGDDAGGWSVHAEVPA